MTTRCKMMIAFRYREPQRVAGLSMEAKQRLWKRINEKIFARIPQEAASRLGSLAGDMSGAGGPPSLPVMAARIKRALNTAAERIGANAEPLGDPMQVPGSQTEYNIHDGVRCCGELFLVREPSGDPWLVNEGEHTAEVMVKFNWEESL